MRDITRGSHILTKEVLSGSRLNFFYHIYPSHPLWYPIKYTQKVLYCNESMYFIEFKNHENLFLGEKKKTCADLNKNLITTCDQMASSYNFIFEKKNVTSFNSISYPHVIVITSRSWSKFRILDRLCFCAIPHYTKCKHSSVNRWVALPISCFWSGLTIQSIFLFFHNDVHELHLFLKTKY